MGKALSQEEIDALLNTVFTGEKTSTDAERKKRKVSLYDFKHPNLISKDQMRLLEKIHEGLVRNFAVFLSVQLRSIVEMNLLAIDQIMYSEFVMSISSPGAIYVGVIDDPYSQFVLELSPSLIIFIVEKLFGGQGNFLMNNRPVSVIERRVMQRVVDKIVVEIAKNWESLKQFTCSIQRFETNPEFVQIVPASEPVVVVSMEIEVRGNTTMMNICYPYTWVSKIISRPEVQEKVLFGVKETKKEDADLINLNLNRTKVDLRAVLGNSKLSTRDLVSLRVGDVIPLNTRINHKIKVFANRKHIYDAIIGKIDKNYAIRIEKIHRGDDYGV